VVAIMEAMKMEVPVLAHQNGVIQILAEQGKSYQAEAIIGIIE